MKQKIKIKTIKPHKQRYDTLGDYFYDELDTLQIRVSDCNNQWYERLIIIHEIIEEMMTRYRGISEMEITQFDLNNIEAEDPGSLPDAPYHAEHMFSLSRRTYVRSKNRKNDM